MCRNPAWLSRRRLLTGCGLAALAMALPPRLAAQDPVETKADGFRIVRTRPGTAQLLGPDRPATAIWGYDGTVPGPILRVKRGEEVKVRLINGLPEPTLIHWHGLRIPNAMDGVPHLTQMPVQPGTTFDYRFVAPDAGTFWYHSHLYSSEQLERGLYGVLIVEEPEPVDVDRDVLLVLDDWRLTPGGDVDAASFRSYFDASHGGRIGGHFTVNGAPHLTISVKANERLRLRLVNAANARVISVRIDRHNAAVMALDGQPTEPFAARNGRVVLAPGNRADLFVDAMLGVGASAPVVIEDGRGDVPIAEIVYDGGPPARAAPRYEFEPLPANPLPERIEFRGAFRLDVPIDGGMMAMMEMRGGTGGGMGGMAGPGGRRGNIPGHGIDPSARIWTLVGMASSGHGPPLFSVKHGRTVMLNFLNRTAFPHGMHVHGHHFRLLDRLDDGWKPYWLDTVLVEARQSARIAFVADNPGKWMIHCHMLEHQETGMAAWFEVT